MGAIWPPNREFYVIIFFFFVCLLQNMIVPQSHDKKETEIIESLNSYFDESSGVEAGQVHVVNLKG